MFKGFSTLWAGSVDFGNIGLEGTRVNARSFPDETLAGALGKTSRIAQKLDDLGYEALWMAEHHFQTEGYECIPNILLLSIHLAHITKNIKLGCGFNVSPMWHPLRLAEDYAVADILTEGRVIFGVGRGYHSREVDTFGVPSTQTDNAANQEMFEEQVDIIFKAFNNRPFSHHGKNYDLPPKVAYRGYELEELTLVPRPRTLPVECWQPVVSASQRQMDFMVKHGIKGVMGGGAAPSGASHDVVKRWQETLAKAGKETELGGDLQVTYHTIIADTEKEAISLARPYFEEHQKFFGPLGFLGLTQDQISALSDPSQARGLQNDGGLPSLEAAMERGWWICGPPEKVTEVLLSHQESYPGLETVHVGPPAGVTTEEFFLDQLGRFAKDVMPKFKN